MMAAAIGRVVRCSGAVVGVSTHAVELGSKRTVHKGKTTESKYIRRFESPWIQLNLGPKPTYPSYMFSQRSRVHRALFLKLHAGIMSFAPEISTWRKYKYDYIFRNSAKVFTPCTGPFISTTGLKL